MRLQLSILVHRVLLLFFGAFLVEVRAFGSRFPRRLPLSRARHGCYIPARDTHASQVSVPLTSRSATESDEENPSERKKQAEESKHHLEDDIAQRLSVSKDLAISALSQPKSEGGEDSTPTKDNREGRRKQKQRKKGSSSLLPPPSSGDFDLPYAQQPPHSKPDRNTSSSSGSTRSKSASSYSSLLPPPLPSLGSEKKGSGEDSAVPNGLSSWEEFLGGQASRKRKKRKQKPTKKSPSPKVDRKKKTSADNLKDDVDSYLPSIRDLFPPDPASSEAEGLENTALEGVLPVSELFYRSSQAISAQDENESEAEELSEGKSRGDIVDDEELPFSAEQSDQLMIDDGKVTIRRNRAKSQKHDKLVEQMASSVAVASSRKSSSKRKRKGRGRKMVRRGMEMLIGGEPVNADPPQRSIELSYKHAKNETDWSRVITLNSRAFGPILHTASVGLLTPAEQGLYCEHFVNAAMKWDVCPKDLKGIVKAYTLEQMIQDNINAMKKEKQAPSDLLRFDSYDDLPSTSNMQASLNAIPGKDDGPITSSENTDTVESQQKPTENTSGVGFGKSKKSHKKKPGNSSTTREEENVLNAHGELMFLIGVTRAELESGHRGVGGAIFRRVIQRGLEKALRSELRDFCFFRIGGTKIKLREEDAGATFVEVQFTLEFKIEGGDLADRIAARSSMAVAEVVEDGSVLLAIAAAAKEEKAWPSKVRARVVEELLFEEDDADEPNQPVLYGEGFQREDSVVSDYSGSSRGPSETDGDTSNASLEGGYDGPFGMPGCSVYAKDDIFLGRGNGGVFSDYSEASVDQSPFKGLLGPILVDAAVARARERHPRVIAIGDVHGCIDELQDLLRRCDYQPGDLVCFLGDLVSKGPDSISVVQLAREIGAIGVRGNHDFEVVRWHQAIKSGVEPPVVGSEHFHIASCLSMADMKWLYSLPWYISSRDLGALFVHAGFVSGIRLAKQNPRLMMNMRSILPDGTVTSKFFNNWPWARLWDGPQTVLFGHDADRGLQQYEHAIGLDTGCVYGGRLTACILPEKRLVSVSARREYFKYRRKHYD